MSGKSTDSDLGAGFSLWLLNPTDGMCLASVQKSLPWKNFPARFAPLGAAHGVIAAQMSWVGLGKGRASPEPLSVSAPLTAAGLPSPVLSLAFSVALYSHVYFLHLSTLAAASAACQGMCTGRRCDGGIRSAPSV